MGDAITIKLAEDTEATYTQWHGLIIKQDKNVIKLSQREVSNLIDFYEKGIVYRKEER